MDISKLKISISILIVIFAQAGALVWYVAQLDATVNQLQREVLRNQATLEITKDLSKIAIFEEKLNGFHEDLGEVHEDLGSVSSIIDDKNAEHVDKLEALSSELSSITSAFELETTEINDNLEKLSIQIHGEASSVAALEENVVAIEANTIALEGVNEENPLVTGETLKEALKSKAQKGKTNRILGENSDRITIIETWMNEILEAERIAEEKKQAKKEKKKKDK